MVGYRVCSHTLVLVLLWAFSSSSYAADKLEVVATFSILGDMVKQIGGEAVVVTTLVGPDGDAHVYRPTPADARALSRAKVVVINGLGFEGWIERLIDAAGFRGEVIVATTGINATMAEEGTQQHGAPDPHAWNDLRNGVRYVTNIAAGLSRADPDQEPLYQHNAQRYREQLEALDAELRNRFTQIPVSKRNILTSHDAFGYMGRAYGLTFLAPQGVSTDSDASAAQVAKIIRQVRKQQITAVFVENIADQRLINQISRETGTVVGGTLYSDALSGPGGPADTYLDMMRHNALMIHGALSLSNRP